MTQPSASGTKKRYLDAIGWLKRNLSGHKVAVDDEHVPYSVLEEYLHEYGRQWDIRNESGNKKKGDAFEVLSIYYLRNHPLARSKSLTFSERIFV